ncbi:MAG: hypothetical protein DYG90_00645 [Chloroflexi bacterium CFX6]|nr:hypothetical protein [Chloroflexi bacterium CFX6]
MALNIDFDSIEGPLATFEIDGSTITYDEDEEGGSAQIGLVVKVSANKTVALPATGEGFHGVLELVEPDGAATVRIRGWARAKKGDGTLTVGTKLVADVRTAAKGYVRSVAAGTLAEVAVARHYCADTSDADAVQIYLG